MDSRRVIGLVVAILGLLALIGGIVYLTVPSDSLPSFFPGHLAGVTAKHATRGDAAVALGAVLLVIGGALSYRRRSLYPR